MQPQTRTLMDVGIICNVLARKQTPHISDLLLRERELWNYIRPAQKRDDLATFQWETKDGQQLSVSEMETSHLLRAFKYALRFGCKGTREALDDYLDCATDQLKYQALYFEIDKRLRSTP